MVHYEQIVSTLCSQLGRFVEVVEEKEHYDLHGRLQIPKKRTHTNNYVDNNIPKRRKLILTLTLSIL